MENVRKEKAVSVCTCYEVKALEQEEEFKRRDKKK